MNDLIPHEETKEKQSAHSNRINTMSDFLSPLICFLSLSLNQLETIYYALQLDFQLCAICLHILFTQPSREGRPSSYAHTTRAPSVSNQIFG